MINTDIINGMFELIGGVFLWMNVGRLYKDKEIKGISIIPTTFFMIWGFWNLYYYPSVNCWLSFYGGLNIVTANLVWLIQMIYYTKFCPKLT